MKSPDSRSQKPENPKPEGNPSEPFQLKITPEKLIVPPDGTLEVKILNPEKETCVVEAYLDSFFFLMKASGEEYVKNVGDSISTILVQKELEPNESLSLSIGYFNGEYTVKNRYKKSWHREEDAPGLGDDSWVEKVEVVKAAPSERIYYNQDRPEGRLTVTHYTIKNRNVAESYEKYYCSERESLMNRWISNNPFKTIELHLEDETEQYKMFREQFQKVKAQRPGLQTVKTAEENVQKAPEPTVSKAGKPRSQKVETAEFKVQKPTKTADKKKGNNNKKKNPCCSVM
ncbi:unnamed protein product [Caenorhabditis brenneri]